MSATRRLLVEFATHDDLVRALRRFRDEGYSHVEVYTPFPSEEIDELLPGPPTPIGWLMFAGGVIGGGGAYFMEWYAAHDFPYHVGGRPLTSWPSFIPVTFELTVLLAAITGLVSLLALARLPRLHHPVFDSAAFDRASQDRFFLAVLTDDPRYTAVGTHQLLDETRPESVQEVDA